MRAMDSLRWLGVRGACGTVPQGQYCSGCQYPGAPFHDPKRHGEYPPRQCQGPARIAHPQPNYSEGERK